MSIGWMTRVWDSPEPSHPTDRLMLLALADNANDEGYCWPSVETLQQKCQLQSLRGARKVLERLEESGFVRRISRPGRSNVYELIALRLDTPELQDRGQAEITPVRAFRGREERRDRGGGTAGPGRAEPQDRVPRNGGTGRTDIEPSREPSINNSGRRDDREPPIVVDLGSDLVEMLIRRGVHAPVATRLLRDYGAGQVREQIEHYDALCAEDETPRRPGWLVQAIKEGYPLPHAQREAAKLFTYHEMLAWCEARGDLSLTRGFTPVKQEGKTLFQLNGSPRQATSHKPPRADHHGSRSPQE